MGKKLSEQQKQFAEANLNHVKRFARDNGIQEDSEEESELNYRLVHAAASYDRDKGSFEWYVDKGFMRGLRTVHRKDKRFVDQHVVLPPRNLLRKEVLPFKETGCIESEKITHLLNMANVEGVERKIINLYYRKRTSKKEICRKLSLSRYMLDKILKETQHKISYAVKNNDIIFDDFLV
tara:strand:- start:170 stop:706 length:537 start_codon:yes stop_codon:yes gene_type:complete